MSNEVFKYQLPESLSFTTYVEVENDINAKINNSFKYVVLDATNTRYISSAGLRVILGLKNKGFDVSVINASTEVFDILDMTGFTKIITVERALRQVSIEGCPLIGKGAHGTVYSLAPDTIVKIYREDTSIDDIKNERELSKKAFVLGLPTAIPLDIVRVGNQYGTVFELLNATSCVKYIMESQENTDNFIDKAAALLKQIHAIKITDGSLPDMKGKTLHYVDVIHPYIKEDEYKKILKIVKDIPESKTLLHCDFHLKNQLMVNNELMLIDMDTLCIGDPVFELASICNSYYEFGIISEEAVVTFLDIPLEKANYLWRGISRKYYSDLNDEEYQKRCDEARLIGIIRAIHFFKKRNFEQKYIDKCLSELSELLKDR